MGLRRGPVDLVCQEDVAEHRPGLELEAPAAGLLDEQGGAGHVGGHQVRGELDAAEAEIGGLGEGPHQAGLAEPGSPFDQYVAASQRRHQQILDHLLLPQDDAADRSLEL